MNIFQLHRTANVTCHHLFYFDTVGTGASINLRHTFFRTAIGIGKVVSFMHFSAHDLEILNVTNVWFHTGLEEIQRGRSVGIGFHHFTTGIMHFRHFRYTGHYITQEFHQTTYPHIFACTYAEYGEHAACSQTLTDTFAHLVFRQ